MKLLLNANQVETFLPDFTVVSPTSVVSLWDVSCFLSGQKPLVERDQQLLILPLSFPSGLSPPDSLLSRRPWCSAGWIQGFLKKFCINKIPAALMSSWPTEAFFCRAALLLKKLEAHLHAKFSSIQATITYLSPPLLCLVLLFNTDQSLEELLQV